MKHGTYVGDQPVLKGETALVRPSVVDGMIFARFNNLALGHGFTHTWLLFPKSDFCVDEDLDDGF